MRHLVFALALLGATATGAQAQTAIPDLKGTWSGKGKSIVFGSHAHHPGSQTPNDPPRVRDIEATYVVEGQDGRLVWGRSASAVADTKEPFAWAISSDNKTIVGADMDGYFLITLRLSRSDGQVLHPQRRGRRQIGGRHLLRDGPQALVSRFRSSHHCAAHSFANFGIKGTLGIYDSSAVLDLKFLHKRAAIMIGTSNPPH